MNTEWRLSLDQRATINYPKTQLSSSYHTFAVSHTFRTWHSFIIHPKKATIASSLPSTTLPGVFTCTYPQFQRQHRWKSFPSTRSASSFTHSEHFHVFGPQWQKGQKCAYKRASLLKATCICRDGRLEAANNFRSAPNSELRRYWSAETGTASAGGMFHVFFSSRKNNKNVLVGAVVSIRHKHNRSELLAAFNSRKTWRAVIR